MNNEQIICKKVAKLFSGRDWHKLTVDEVEIVADLTQAGWIEEKIQPNGFVGKALVET